MVRLLADNPLNGGLGFSIAYVRELTPRQIYFLLEDRKSIEASYGVQKLNADQVLEFTNRDGTIKGRSGTGAPMRAVLRGKSKASILREAAEAAAAAERAQKTENKKRRRRHGA